MELAFKRVLPVLLPAVILNAFFLYTSQVLDYVVGPAASAAYSCLGSSCYHTNPAYVLEQGIYDLVSAIFVNPLMGLGEKYAVLVGLDCVSLLCLVALFLALYTSNLHRGGRLAFLRAVQLTDLCVMPLGAEILADYLMHGSQENYQMLNMHVFNIQEYLGVLSAFSNLDLLGTTTVIFVLATLTLRSRRP